jgi:predicted O-linked N-acetylglucosamine transferase (SPINDLY family)
MRDLAQTEPTGEEVFNLLATLKDPEKQELKALRIRILNAATERSPVNDYYACSLLQELRSGSSAEETLALARKIALRTPTEESHCSLVAEVFSEAFLHEECAEFLKRATALHPEAAHLFHNLGISYVRMRMLPEALEAFKRAVELKPYSELSLTMAGSVLKELGKIPEALEFHGAASRMNPKSALVLYNLGNALHVHGELKGALQAYNQALALNPDGVDLLNNLCSVMMQMDLFHLAIPHLMKLTKLRGNTENDLARLSFALREANRLQEALDIAEILVRQSPSVHTYRILLGACLSRIGRAEDAIVQYKKAIQLRPGELDSYKSLVYTANYLPYENPEELFEFYRKYSELIEKPVEDSRYQHEVSDPFPRKLRVGYVSGDFCHHPVTTFIEPVFLNHDHSSFDVYCYYNFARFDGTTERLKALPLNWRDVAPLSDSELCETIRKDRIDILVDLSGHTTRNRLSAFALKPAPVQVTMVGCMQTTGLRAMDYRISDAWLDPEGQSESLHTESLVRMKSGAVCFMPHSKAPEPAPLPCLRGEPFTFGSYNNLAKVTPHVLEVWSRVLKALPEARMQLVADGEEPFLRGMEQRGVPRSRFKILRRMPEPEYLESHGHVDLILDTFPFNGLTVSMNALWMGVPCVTLSGNTSASRAGASLLSRVGLGEFVASSPDEYVEIAVRHARAPQALGSIRTGLRDRMRSVWADAAAYTGELEMHFKEMWKSYSGFVPVAPAAADSKAGRPEPQDFAPAAGAGPGVQADEAPAGRTRGTPDATLSAEAISAPPGAGQITQAELLSAVSEIAEVIDPTELLQGTIARLESLESPLAGVLALEESLLSSADKHRETHWKRMAVCGEFFTKLGFSEHADRCFQRVEKRPSSADEWSWLGRSLLRAARVEEARDTFEVACGMEGVKPDATLALSCLLADFGKTEEAEFWCRRTISLGPSIWEAYLNLGNLLYRRGAFREALNVAEPAVRFSSDPKLLLNLAVYQEKCGEFEAAIISLAKVIEKIPESPAAFLNLGNALLFMGMPNEAFAAYSKARKFEPGSNDVFSNHLHSMNYLPDPDQEAAMALHADFAKQFEEPLLPHKPHTNTRDPHRRLKIAFVSPDLRTHSVSYFVEPIFKHLDRKEFEVWGILSHTWRDRKTEYLKSLCDHWIDAGSMSHEQLAERVRQEEIDIFVDLICHSAGSRVLTFVRKPAPVQVTMIGMQQTSGIRSMDYRVTDAFMDPPGMTEKQHTEELMRLPLAFAFEPPKPSPPIAALPALKNGYITFGSFNNFAKANSYVLEAWAEILHQVPNSRLVAVVPKGTMFEAFMQAKNIAPERIISSERKAHDAYLHLHDPIDFALDCFPFGGLTVSAFAAWMGLPTMTVAGNTPCARAGASLQHSLGLDDFIAKDPGEFVRKAVALTKDLPYLASVRASMRERMARQLTNGEAFSKSFGAELRRAWKRWCDGEGRVVTPL